MQKSPSPYAQLLQRGPFPGRVDPFAEDARYFHQIHDGLLNALSSQMAQGLLSLGYYTSQEDSLQISEILCIPDLQIRRFAREQQKPSDFNYSEAASEVLAEPGIPLRLNERRLSALHIHEMGTNNLVTVIEVVSPRNKTHPLEMAKYRAERNALFLTNRVHVVEVDLTRSYHRLLDDTITRNHPYHIAIFFPDDPIRVITQDLGEPLKRCAIPLRETVMPADFQPAYEEAYQRAVIAPQILDHDNYLEQALPFPTLLTTEQRNDIMRAVETWQAELKQLRGD